MQMFHVLRSAYFNYSIFGYPVTETQSMVFVVFMVFAILLCYDKWNRWPYETLANKLRGPPDYPIIGSCLEGFGGYYEKLLNYGQSYNYGSFKLWAGNKLIVVISKPEDLQIIFNSSKALDKGFLYNMATKFLGESLITAPVDKWKIHRRLINPLFKYENIKEMFFPIFQEKSKLLIQNLQKEKGKTQPFDILDYASDIILNTVCQTTMDYNLDSQADMGFKKSVAMGFELIVNRATKVWLYPEIIYNLYIKLFDYEKYYTNVQNLPKHIIEKKKNELAQKFKNKFRTDTDLKDGEKKCFKGLVETLMDSNKAELGLSDEDIMSHVITIVAAGFESTSLTVSYCLLLLAIYPDIQDRVYDEIYSILGDSDEPITIEQTTSLVYLKQVIHETLRLFPTAPVMARQLQDDVTI
ncbi:Cytochrome P450,Cytochrome P450, E-class, group I, partial [Cinara cedri]